MKAMIFKQSYKSKLTHTTIHPCHASGNSPSQVRSPQEADVQTHVSQTQLQRVLRVPGEQRVLQSRLCSLGKAVTPRSPCSHKQNIRQITVPIPQGSNTCTKYGFQGQPGNDSRRVQRVKWAQGKPVCKPESCLGGSSQWIRRGIATGKEYAA